MISASAGGVGLVSTRFGHPRKNLGPDDADVATTLINLGTHLDDSGHYSEARVMLERALKIRRQVFGPAHPLVGFAELALSSAYDSQGEYDEAEKLAQDSLAIFRRGLPADHPKISEALNMIAVLRAARRDFAGAVPLMREVFDRFRRTLGDDHPDTLTAQNNLAYALLHSGNPLVGRHRCDEAMPLLDASIAQIDKTEDVAPEVRPSVQLLRAACLGDRAEAAQLGADARQRLATVPDVQNELYPTTLGMFRSTAGTTITKRN